MGGLRAPARRPPIVVLSARLKVALRPPWSFVLVLVQACERVAPDGGPGNERSEVVPGWPVTGPASTQSHDKSSTWSPPTPASSWKEKRGSEGLDRLTRWSPTAALRVWVLREALPERLAAHARIRSSIRNRRARRSSPRPWTAPPFRPRPAPSLSRRNRCCELSTIFPAPQQPPHVVALTNRSR